MTKLSGSDSKSTLYCSFCGKSQHEVRKLIAGPTVFICDECVELCNDIIREEIKGGIAERKDGAVPTPLEICQHLDNYVIGQNTDPETTDNFDLGVRYRTSKIQAQVSGWFTKYDNRLASAFDEETQRNLYRNLGRVDKYGIDGSIAYQPIPELALYAFGSYMKSDIKDDVQVGSCTAAQAANPAIPPV